MKVVLAPKELLADPESLAMLQAFYSRSKRSIEDRLAETTLDTAAIKKKLATYFVGYGHDSIGQVGMTCFFIEDVSLLAAKAIQNNMLYNGQESSTRYIDFTQSPRVNPLPNLMGSEIQKEWLDINALVLIECEKALFKRNAPEPESNYQGIQLFPEKEMADIRKACRVKAFDIARAFLPAGVTTNLSWVTSLATLNRELARLFAHPLQEIKDIAHKLNEIVKVEYPSIYKDFENDADMLDLVREYSHPAYHYDNKLDLGEVANLHPVQVSKPTLTKMPSAFDMWPTDKSFSQGLAVPLRPRKKYARMPHYAHSYCNVQALTVLDWASFRDVQRHRPLSPSSPCLSMQPLGNLIHVDGTRNYKKLEQHFAPWYIQSLVDLGVFDLVKDRIIDLMLKIESLRDSGFIPELEFKTQYYLPIGLLVAFTQTGSIGDWIYTLELRSGETVHPTVRQWACHVWSRLEDDLPNDFLEYANVQLKLTTKFDKLLDISYRRAKQDIVEKEQT